MTNWPAPDPSNVGALAPLKVDGTVDLDAILERSDALNPPIGAEISAWLSDFTAHSPKGIKAAAEAVREGR